MTEKDIKIYDAVEILLNLNKKQKINIIHAPFTLVKTEIKQ